MWREGRWREVSVCYCTNSIRIINRLHALVGDLFTLSDLKTAKMSHPTVR